MSAVQAWSPVWVEFVDRDGAARRESLTDCAVEAFESAMPVRSFASYRGQRNWPGLWWAATMGRHVGYESWLERDHLMLLDFDCEVVAFASQPFWLHWPGEGDRARSHAPDFFARRADGSAVVIDCRPDDRIRPEDAASFEATAAACAVLGWGYERVGAPDPILAENVRWLAGYRNPRFADPGVEQQLRAVFADGRPLMDGVTLVGRSVAVLPVLFHLLWRGGLHVDLSVPLSDTRKVWGGP